MNTNPTPLLLLLPDSVLVHMASHFLKHRETRKLRLACSGLAKSYREYNELGRTQIQRKSILLCKYYKSLSASALFLLSFCNNGVSAGTTGTLRTQYERCRDDAALRHRMEKRHARKVFWRYKRVIAALITLRKGYDVDMRNQFPTLADESCFQKWRCLYRWSRNAQLKYAMQDYPQDDLVDQVELELTGAIEFNHEAHQPYTVVLESPRGGVV
tara:strand:- start:353 stop:994 length:642 start_codon:yes stop_codon:yes gene_type:complete